jgi:hypothetical protein
MSRRSDWHGRSNGARRSKPDSSSWPNPCEPGRAGRICGSGRWHFGARTMLVQAKVLAALVASPKLKRNGFPRPSTSPRRKSSGKQQRDADCIPLRIADLDDQQREDATCCEMKALGIEPRTYGLKVPLQDSASPLCNETCGTSPNRGDSTGDNAPELAAISRSWPTLPAHIKAAVMALIQTGLQA